ncbi:hypothetical protein MRB56_15555 [Halomonas cupida]|uniref:hypothetical protein n=1 Tax=Halomonas cupida TaxID=44933 RepID=UPI0039B44F1B
MTLREHLVAWRIFCSLNLPQGLRADGERCQPDQSPIESGISFPLFGMTIDISVFPCLMLIDVRPLSIFYQKIVFIEKYYIN